MTTKEFQDHLEDVVFTERNQDAESRAELRNIAREIGIISLDFSADTLVLLEDDSNGS